MSINAFETAKYIHELELKLKKIGVLCEQFEYWCESDERLKDEIRGLCK